MYAKTLAVFVALASLLVRPAIASEISPQTIFELTNDARAKHGLAPLAQSQLLEQAAIAKTQDMITQGYFDHVGPNGQTPWALMDKAGYRYEYGGENLAVGFSSAEDMVQAWLVSPSHRENLLDRNFEDIGIAALPAIVDGLPDLIVVQMFGSLADEIESNRDLTSYVNTLLGVGDGY
ncbi:hypothetical protein HYZ64_03940 [Candidatus Berkelbacteria bacterium]|nr:hypothetical protein [Candidatus Berkelbacteria bacterium]